ncbi:MBL fold metallo-hydrolase [Candidatus Pantoea carbekii]|uniref:Uncharacterized protein n=1 Tax=Candidatus Pantoea carbekii TaxID=1235990 RepID=U3U8K0_9GAMM|nr:MBL fold metallo-hydrolase [Candidatus Pantoea carbekii]AKC32152.1 metallo-beta-lactamase family protein YcbL [Candidatus Pantoea carbekii]BAO00679.1 hypothetical protein HHS_07090 [Candidatus Pantoea carbekii]
MNYQIIQVTSFAQNCSVLWDELYLEKAALVDPGGDTETIMATLSKHTLIPSQILLTHGHLDHVGSAGELAKYYKIPILGPHPLDAFLLNSLSTQSSKFGLKEECSILKPDRWLKEGDRVQIGNITLNVLHCPGHTPGHIVFFSHIDRLLISGDVIFKGSIGRTDFPKSSYRDLIKSIKSKLMPLGDDITFLPGHGAISTLGYERINNIFLQ